MIEIEVYTPDSSRVIHYTYADMTARQIVRPVHLVQYDQGLPIIAVKLYNDGLEYTIPANATVNIRCGKVDGNFVYNPALGWDSAMHTVYFEVTKQMTALAGEINPIVEIELNNKIVSSGAIAVQIDFNPVQEQSIRSTTEYITAKQYAEQAVDASAKAASSASNATTSATNAKKSETAAANSALLAQAAYEEILGADVGKFSSQLANEHSVLQPIYDSSGQNICDSSGKEIQGRVIFADESEVVSLKQQVNNLDTFIRSVISRLGYVTDHALLDSDYKGL
ncbi:unknown [Eubacterium sp. CAG:603]|nr:unknown [Eubacterium sp. CAG:603]